MFYRQRPKKSQSGAVLVISLIMLLLLTLIGVTSIQTTSLDEKMAGNLRNQNIAFQSAESTLVTAENWLSSLASKPALPTIADNPAGKIWMANSAKTTSNSWKDWSQATPSTSNYYFIEVIKDDASGTYFRITAKGLGVTKKAQVILQSIYVKSF